MSAESSPSLSSISAERCEKYWELWGWMARWSGMAADERETPAARREAERRARDYAEGIGSHVRGCAQCSEWWKSFKT